MRMTIARVPYIAILGGLDIRCAILCVTYTHHIVGADGTVRA